MLLFGGGEVATLVPGWLAPTLMDWGVARASPTPFVSSGVGTAMTTQVGAHRSVPGCAPRSPTGNGRRLVFTEPAWLATRSANYVHERKRLRLHLKVLDMSVRPLSHTRTRAPAWDSLQHQGCTPLYQ